MRKYFLVFKNSIQRAIIYKFNTFAGLLVQILSFGMFFYLWSSVYSGGGEVGEYTLPSIITYYLLTLFVGMIIRGSFIAWAVADDIRLGHITNYLLKPIKYFWFRIFESLGNTLYRFVVYLLSIFIISLFFGKYLVISLGFEQTAYFLAFLFIGVILYLLFFYIIGVLAFWLGNVQGVTMTMYAISSFFSGSIVPLDLLPNYIMKINDFLPFKYMIFVPVSVFTGKISLSLSIFIGPIIWIAILYILSVIMFNRGIKKYEGYGA